MLNYKKPAFWVIIVAVIACIVVAVCFMTNPKKDEPDLSFLNYKPLLKELKMMKEHDIFPKDIAAELKAKLKGID